jgi:hypothetical protein
MNEGSDETATLCPSAQPDWRGSIAIGVVGGTADRPYVSHFKTARSVTLQLLQLAEPVQATEVFRFAAPCMCGGCIHFKQQRCRLIDRIVADLPEVTNDLPHCTIRPQCRWWLQQGPTACHRCPQVVTENYNPSTEMREVATP